MDRFLLDSNILSDFIRNPSGRAARRLAVVPSAALCTSIVAAAELRYGAARSGSVRLLTAVEGVLSRLEVLPLAAPIDRIYADLRIDLEKEGTSLAAHDLLIAAHALAADCTLVSDDRVFRRVPGLRFENWLR